MSTTLELEPAGDTIARTLSPRYYNPQFLHHYRKGGQHLVIGWADGANAGGLIGTECCGLLVVDQGRMHIVLDEVKSGLDALSAPVKKLGAVLTLVEMDPDVLSEFMEGTGRMRYNPFTIDRQTFDVSKRVGECDAMIRRQFGRSTLLTQFERLCAARQALGSPGSRSFFKKALYQMLTLHGGHIAHYNIDGFWEAQLKEDNDFKRNLEYLSKGETQWGFPIIPEKVPEIEGLKAAASHYLNKI